MIHQTLKYLFFLFFFHFTVNFLQVNKFKMMEGEEEEKKASWIEIELVGEDDEPIPGEKYKITLPDESVAEGTLDEKGFARIEGFEKGSCKVSFPRLDKEAWEKI